MLTTTRAGRRSGAHWAIAAAALISTYANGSPAASGTETPFYATHFEKVPTPAAMTALGRALFFDKSLSASGSMACASCHDPANFYGPPNDSAVQRGGIDGRQFGLRSVPSLRYAQGIPPFTEHYFEDEGDDSIDQGPAGGRTWDGRAQSTHEQAQLPLFSPFEMANRSAEEVVAKVQGAAYAAQFRQTFGDRVFEDKSLAFKGILMALETFQQSPADFYPYSSKYDAYLRHQATLSSDESRGLAVFNDVKKGNCARCHPSAMRHGAFPQFTDFGFAAVGAPRNPAIPANADRHYYDLGSLRAAAHRLKIEHSVLRHVSLALAAQCRDPPGILPQWGVPSTGGCRTVLCATRHTAAKVVFTRRRRQRCEI